MAFLSLLGKRRRTLASVSTVSIFSTAITALAIANPGYEALDAEVNDSGVWVTNGFEGLLGRFNYQASSVDAALETLTADFDAHQQDESVVLQDLTAGTLKVVDPAAVTLATPADLPGGVLVGLGGDRVAVLDPAEGMLWTQSAAGLQSVSAESTEPLADGLVGGVLAVGLDGTVHVATAADATLRSYPRDDDGQVEEPVVRRLADVAAEDRLQVTAVGGDAVVHDLTQDALYLPGLQVQAESGDGLVLQEPGPEASDIVYATTTALVSQPLGGGAPRLVSADGSADPTRPVVVKGCAYGAWAGAGRVVRSCGDDQPLVQSVETLASGAQLRYRTNQGFVVLNELISGTVWLADDEYQRLDEIWDDVLTSVAGEAEEADPADSPSRDPLQNRDLPNRPPVANDDDFGVRPGRTTILPVLYNDTDPDGDVLTAAPDGAAPSFGDVEVIYGGTGMQVTVPADARGSTSFTYEANDGREDGTDTATVTLEVRADDENGLPEPIPGRETVGVVEQGGSVEMNVLADWRDPDGDPLVLAGATPTTDDEVRFRPDGLVAFQDSNTAQGRKAVRIAVSDGRGEHVEGTAWVDVRPEGDVPPKAVADHATTAPGRPVVIRPLENDTDPNGDELRIARVDLARPDATAVPDFDTGTVTFTADTPGAYDFTYLLTDGPHTVYGLIRIDVLAGTADLPPVAVLDRALLPSSGSVFVDVLGNDFDPGGGILVVQSVTVPAEAGLRVAILNHEILEVSAIRTPSPGTSVRVTYQISNGISSDVGEVLVIPLPEPERVQSPTAVDDQVTARIGDVVSIPVLANDTHPQDLPLSLVRELYDVSDPSLGLLFTTEDAVRFQAGQTPGTLYATYEVTDGRSEPDSAQITIQIKDASTNAAPKPQSLTARVLAGTRARIAIPLDGIDPDGDSVTLLGLQDAPTLGRIADWGEGWMEYQADSSAAGTDSFTYAVRDTGGLQATATVLVGVAPAPRQDQAPIPQDDYVTTRPGREVTVAALANDVDPEGGDLGLVAVQDGGALAAEVREDRVVIRTPGESEVYPATYTARYTVKDAPRGLTATGSVIVQVTPDAPVQAPVARDDALILTDVVGREAVDVPVLKNDDDPDGSTADLAVAVSAETARVLPDGRVRVTLLPDAQILPYSIRDLDGQEGMAFIRVPGVADLRPVLAAGAGAEVTGTDPLTIALADHVLVAPGKSPVITRPDRVAGLNGSCTAQDEATLVFTATAGYDGLAACSFEVTDGTGPDDPDGRTAVLTFPITVVVPPGADQPNQQPEFTAPAITVPSGESSTTDLVATDPDPGDQEKLRFAIGGDVPAGFAARIEGTRLLVEADAHLRTGATASLDLSVTDGITEPVVRPAQVTVVGSGQPLATVIDDEVPNADQGRTYRVDVLANDVNPFPGEPLRIVSAVTESGEGTLAVDGTSVVITPGAAFAGTMVVRYRVGDATQDPLREVDGRVRLTVRGRPEAPLTPTVLEVRSQTIVLNWAPPVNNGAPISTYTVTSSQGYARDCPTTTCTLDGLTNDVEYAFSVTATNEVGTSDPSPRSAPARPDERPDSPQAPTSVFGDGSLTVTWVNRAYSDRSPIQSVNLQISPAPANGPLQVSTTGTQYVWTGLTNGTAYQVRVQAVNKAPEPSDWSAFSASEVPAGVPTVPAPPTSSSPTQVGTQAQMVASWAAPDSNGDPISEYTLRVLRSGSLVNTLTVAGGATSQAVTVDTSENDYTFTVAARNKAGISAASAPSAPRRAVIAPGAVTGLRAAPLNNAIELTFGPAPGNGASASETRYQYAVNGGAWTNLSADKRITSGVPNNGTYTASVRAVSTVDGAEYVGPATAANAVAPFGPPGAPSVNATQGTTWVTVSWSPPARNGRDFAVWIRVDGGAWENVGAAAGSRQVGNGYSQTHTIEAQTRDVEGQVSQTRSASGRSQDPPPPQASVSKGEIYNPSVGTCTGDCRRILLKVSNFPAGTYTLKCWDTYGGEGVFWTQNSFSIPANGTVSTPCAYGYPNEYVWLEVVGIITTPRARWGDLPAVR